MPIAARDMATDNRRRTVTARDNGKGNPLVRAIVLQVPGRTEAQRNGFGLDDEASLNW
jgi:hypothetical protein